MAEKRKLVMVVDGDRVAYVGDGYGEEVEHLEEALEDTMTASSILSVDISDMGDSELSALKTDSTLLNKKYASLIAE